ncbi:hypothetical protein F5B22DRAFT_600654 [Xylaria bambusicola]|uniref:uncharacterized protein n=1 Tax=Xylaria bambusicola TaxID=326684 RepID=UPI002008710E|nr:uncharacterized protein F5B22DRAFT_600654 [Xylaria bambusicola]KAI0518283.1 hypothetical protein F5B22DRAFT_600654 [Xylaria bambusicola]
MSIEGVSCIAAVHACVAITVFIWLVTPVQLRVQPRLALLVGEFSVIYVVRSVNLSIAVWIYNKGRDTGLGTWDSDYND